jgi:TRAP-type mannitol/chloroaromatic compound transport system permease small subunit
MTAWRDWTTVPRRHFKFFHLLLRVYQGCQMVGIFSNQKSQYEFILESLAMKDVNFFGHSVYLLPFRIFCGLLVYFVVILVHFGVLYQEKSGNPEWPTTGPPRSSHLQLALLSTLIQSLKIDSAFFSRCLVLRSNYNLSECQHVELHNVE